MSKPMTDPVIRFWKSVNKNGPIHPIHGQCWVWIKSLQNGYGQFTISNGSKWIHVYAHRFSWQVANGSIKDDLWVLHRCDNPRCVRPDHLFLGTSSDNQLDLENKAIGRTGIPVNVGESNSACKLTGEIVVEIRVRHSLGEIGAELAREFDISESQLYRIINRKSWKHV